MIKITGADRLSFLQGLITQDINLLTDDTIVYSAMLTPQGKYLFDFFISQQDEAICLECHSMQAPDLYKKLKMHKLRSDVQVELIEKIPVYALCEHGYDDPRHTDMGKRSYTAVEGEEQPYNTYVQKSISLAIPDCFHDLEAGRSTPFEGNLDRLNAISFTKGCYMGQELVSRIHHRGLIKKRLQPVQDAGGSLKLELSPVSND